MLIDRLYDIIEYESFGFSVKQFRDMITRLCVINSYANTKIKIIKCPECNYVRLRFLFSSKPCNKH